MKSIKIIIIGCAILVGMEQIDCSHKSNGAHSRPSGGKKSEQHGGGHEKSSEHGKGSKKSGDSSSNGKKELSPMPSSIIEDCLKAIGGIPKRSSEKGAKPESQGSKKDFSNKVDLAYKAYKKIFGMMKTHSVTQGQDTKIRKALIVLFNSRNIKNMVWRVQVRDAKKGGKSSGKAPQKSSAKKQSGKSKPA